MIPLASFALAACLAVSPASDQILAGDLVTAFPEWATIPPETPLGLAPAPGVQRVILVPELRHFAERWKLPSPEQAVCVTRRVVVSTADRLLAAMQRELPAAHIELLDFSLLPAPQGDLVFPVAGLRQSPAGGYWSGYIAYGGKHRFAIWARVKVRVAVPRIIAGSELKAGLPLDARLLRLEIRDEMPATGFVSTIEEVLGRVPRRSIAAGTALRSEWLETAKLVLRGETVQVDVLLGGAHLKFEGVAQASGAAGETIPIQNPVSMARFAARVESKGKVVVIK